MGPFAFCPLRPPTQLRLHPRPCDPACAVWGIGAPRGSVYTVSSTSPHTAADTPESLQFSLGRLGDRDAPWGRGAPWEQLRVAISVLTHSGGYTRVYAYPVLPRGVPVPQKAQARPEGLGCVRRGVGVARPCAYHVLPRVVPIPQISQGVVVCSGAVLPVGGGGGGSGPRPNGGRC